MRSTVQKWGHSLVIPIPEALASSASLAEGSTVEIYLQGDTVVIAAPPDEGPSLDELLAMVTPDNLHGETGAGGSVGLEAW